MAAIEHSENTTYVESAGDERSASTPCRVVPWAVSGNILGHITVYMPLANLPSLRRVSRHFHGTVQSVLAKNPKIRRGLDAHLAQMLKGGKRVWVSIRARPQHEDSGITISQNCVMVGDGSGGNDSTYFFDKVFDGAATQSQVWSHVQPQLMRCMLQHEHACLFAYGQTGSGKTHTMFGDPDVAGEEGIAFRAVKNLSDLLLRENAGADGPVPTVDFSFLEVYNEKVHDLLDQQRLCQLSEQRVILSPGTKYKAPRYSQDMYVVPNVKRVSCDISNLVDQVGTLLQEGAASRMVGRTVFNPRSSRSHAIATLHINWRGVATPRETGDAGTVETRPSTPQEDEETSVSAGISRHAAETRLYLVDLAGSERAGQYALSSDQLKEGVNINQSLSTLGRVVGALARGKGEHVPYRDSALTWLLSDAITGQNARAFMVAAVQPVHLAETLSTLRYAHDYSSLQSDLSTRIPKVKQQVRQLQQRRETLAREFDAFCFHINMQTRGMRWDKSTLSERHVRVRRAAKQSFAQHPYLKWIDGHESKLSISAIGVVSDVVPIPPEVTFDDMPDGRRRAFRKQDQENTTAPPLDGWDHDLGEAMELEQEHGNVVRVIYAGRHGHPPIILWYPEEALDDITPPLEIRRLLTDLDATSAQLETKKAQLRGLETQFAAQRNQCRGAPVGDAHERPSTA